MDSHLPQEIFIPAINGRSLIELFFHSIGTELAHRPSSHFRLLLPMDDKIIGGATSSDNPKLNQQRIQDKKCKEL
ncbi:unnamed protein product [Cuscuta campestris]|uniref:Uncharacterized protein n=1 Tax=Cuscuta campestris TaxID=132261 RepID=A0A484L144_9ASTE|nr:unnamed protein product [Cuscuta campestris]